LSDPLFHALIRPRRAACVGRRTIPPPQICEISALREKRSDVAPEIVDLPRQIDRLQADLFHIDAVLRL
jgi:hypothetical protein